MKTILSIVFILICNIDCMEYQHVSKRQKTTKEESKETTIGFENLPDGPIYEIFSHAIHPPKLVHFSAYEIMIDSYKNFMLINKRCNKIVLAQNGKKLITKFANEMVDSAYEDREKWRLSFIESLKKRRDEWRALRPEDYGSMAEKKIELRLLSKTVLLFGSIIILKIVLIKLANKILGERFGIMQKKL